MSDNTDLNLLDDDDLEDDTDYDLGNDDEDRLLADDYEVQGTSQATVSPSGSAKAQRANNFMEPDEPAEDDILDLGDGFDDLDSEIQDTLESGPHTSSNEIQNSSKEADLESESGKIESNQSIRTSGEENTGVEDVSADPVPHLESEEEDDTKNVEGRDRFKSERTNIISLKKSVSMGNIPDSLDNVIPHEETNFKKRGRGKWTGNRQQRQNARGGLNQRFYQQKSQQHHNHYQQKKHYQQDTLPFPLFQEYVPPPLYPQTQQPQKIHINPHFRGAVQPHPDARLIWDRESGMNNGFSPRMPADGDYRPIPHGGFDGQFHPGPGPNTMNHDGFQPHCPSYPPPMHPPQPPPQFYNDNNYMEPPPAPGPGPSLLPDPWQNHGIVQQVPPPLLPHQMGPPQQPPNDFFREPPNIFPPPQQPFPHYQDHGPPRFTPNPNLMPPPDIQGQGSFRNHQHDDATISGHFRQQNQRFQNMKRRAQFQGPPNGPKKITVPKQQQNFGTPTQTIRQAENSVAQTSPGTNVIPVKRFETPQKKKKRMQDMSNLHEVKTVDTLPQQPPENPTVEAEAEDEETREYRRKIEEQKRMREKVLQVKETRRMMAALEKQRQLKLQQQNNGDTEPPQGNAIATIVNRNPVQPQVGQTASVTVGRGRAGVLRNSARKAVGLQQQQQQRMIKQQCQNIVTSKQLVQDTPVLQNKVILGAQKITVPTGRIVRAAGQQVAGTGMLAVAKRMAVQSPQQQQQQTQQQVRQVVLRGAMSGKKVQPQQQRLVIQNQAAISSGRTVVASEADSSQVRTSRSIAVDNLSAATDEIQLRTLCLRVGPVEKVQMLPQQKRAIITFVNPASAADFIKLYQRKMVDLSLISVSFVP